MSAGEKLSETERPAYLDEFERKLAAALTQQTDARKTRFGATRSSDANVEVPSSPSLSEAIAPDSIGAEQPKVEQASSKTRKTRVQLITAKATNASLQGDSAHVESDVVEAPEPGGALDVHPARPTAPRLDLAETLSTVRALKSRAASSKSSAALRVSDKVTRAAPDEAPPADLRRGNGNVPKQETEAALGLVDSTAEQAVDVEASQAEVEAVLGTGAEAAREPASLHAHPVPKVIERFSGDWRLMAGAWALAGVALVSAIALPRAMLALPNPPPGTDERSVRDTTTRDDSAARLKDSALAAEDRLGARPEGVVAPASAPKANEAPGVTPNQASIGLANLAPTGSTLETSDPMGSASPLAPAAQPSGLEPASAVLTAAATSSQAAPAQSTDFKPAPAVSPKPAPVPMSAALPTEGASAENAARPATKPVRNAHNVGMAKLSAPRGDAPKKVGDTPSIGATVTKNDATSVPVVAEKSNQPLPLGTHNFDKEAIESNGVQAHPPPPAASAQLPFDDPTRGMGSGAVPAPSPVHDETTAKPNQGLPVGTPTSLDKPAIASNVVKSPFPPSSDPGPSAQQPLDHPLRPTGRGTVSRQYPVDSKPRDGAAEKPSQSLPVGMKGAVASVPAASDQPLDRLKRATGGIFGAGTAQAQHSADSTSRDAVIEKQRQPLPVATPANHDNAGGESKLPQAASVSAAAAATPAAPNQPSGLY
jgi:hypothetical protein